LLEDTSHAKAPFERVANISKAIKNLQVMSKIPIISVSQMNRTKNEDGEQDTTQIGLSDRIGQDATCILMLSRDISYADEDKTKVLDDKLIINIVKSRDGGNGKLIYKVDFNTGNFFYLNQDYTEQEAEAEAASFTAQDGIAF
jgi:replicative DNA helicase